MIPVFEPEYGDAEIQSVVDALRKGEISGSFGESIPTFEKRFAEYIGCKHGVAVTSGTTALQLAVAAAEVGAGDEVLMSASTNIATALAALHNEAVPVPVDSESITWNLDLDLLESLTTTRTKAIIPVHLFGHPVDMDRLMVFADERSLIVIEDCAESHGAECRGRMTGSFGHMACFSFYANKIITTGEGGMVTTNDDHLAKRLRLLRNLAFTTPRFRHELAGHNFRMTGYQAAFGLPQLDRIEETLAKKRTLARMYTEALASTAGLQLPTELDWAKHVYWMYAIVVEPTFGITRDQLAARLRDLGIETRTFFCPMNQQPCLIGTPGFRPTPCPVADRLWESGLYLPSSTKLTAQDVNIIARSIRDARSAAA